MTGTFDASHCGNSIVAKVQDILEAFFIFMFNNEYHVSTWSINYSDNIIYTIIVKWIHFKNEYRKKTYKVPPFFLLIFFEPDIVFYFKIGNGIPSIDRMLRLNEVSLSQSIQESTYSK